MLINILHYNLYYEKRTNLSLILPFISNNNFISTSSLENVINSINKIWLIFIISSQTQ